MTIDVQALMQTQFNQPTSTKRLYFTPLECLGTIKEVKLEAIEGKKDPTKTYLRFNAQIELDSAVAAAQVKMERATVFYDFLLDMTEGGGLDMSEGKNVKLGKLREAVGQNNPGQPWGFQDLKGQVVKVKAGIESFDGDYRNTVESITKAM